MKTAEPFIKNVSRKAVLSQNGRVLRGLATGIGAMFRGLRGQAMVLVWWRSSQIAITNWFVPEAIDVVWVDESWRVVDLHSRFAAGAFRTVNKVPARYVVELPAGTVEITKTKVGDQLRCAAFSTEA